MRTGTALICLLGVALGGPALADTMLTVGKAAPNADPIIPVNVGYKAGIFKKHGLDLKIVDFLGGSKMDQAMAAGAIDIGDGAGTEMAFVAKGVPMLAICESTSTFPFLSVGVGADSPLKTLADLKGKKMGISSTGSLTDWLAHELARHEGWAPGDLTEVAIGNGAAGDIAAFRTHQVDADIGTTSLFVEMEAEKTGRVLAPVTDFEGPAASGALFASTHLIDTNPDAVRAFVAAWVETIDYMRAHKAETVKYESPVTGFPESVMSREYDMTIGMFTKHCEFDPQSLATLQRAFVDMKLATGPIDMSKLYTDKFIPK
ncbi:MAG TPA: ABC transporter substrate-binding protein [Stellaceae bacterium]|nr:ABC transporter substrate-binding protein [Stellaceae bacterium]